MESGINLDLLPPLTLVESLPMHEIVDEIASKAALENAAPADPAYRAALAFAYREQLLRQRTNDQAKGLMLAFASSSQLDHIGATYYRTERLSQETDEAYRARLQLSPQGYSVAGPQGAYEFYALSASADIRAINVISPSPAVIELYVLTYRDDGVASDALCRQVERHIQDYRPMGDRVTAFSAEIIDYQVTARLWVEKGADIAAIRQKALAQTTQYTLDENTFAGFISGSGLDAALTVAKVKKVELSEWQDIEASEQQVPLCQGINIEVSEL